MLSNSELIVFCEQMGMVLKAGLSAMEGIVTMKEDAGVQASPLKEIYEQIAHGLEETGMFGEALRETNAFPEYLLKMVDIGEQTGNLDEIMVNLSDYYEREETMVQDMKSAITYPLFMLFMMLLILLVMIVKVMPIFNQVYAQLGGQITGPAAILFHAGQGLGKYYGIAASVAVLVVFGGWWLLKTKDGKKVFRKIISRFFATGHILHKMNRSRFVWVMSLSLRSGMDYDSAFVLAQSLIMDDEITSGQIAECREKVEEGTSLAEAAIETHLLTGLYGSMLRIAERTGESENVLKKIAVQEDYEITVSIQNFVSVLEPTLVAILSVFVGVILLSVMVPLMGILSTIG